MGLIPRGSANVCTTPACVDLAANVLGSLALDYTELDPCTKFDQFACGNWASRNAVPAGEESIDSLGAVHVHVYDLVRQILENPYPTGKDAGWITVDLTEQESQIDQENFDKLQTAYEVCLNTTAQEEEGITTLRVLVSTVLQNFPLPAGNANATKYDHSQALGKILPFFESLGIETMQRIFQTQKPSDPDELILVIQPPSNPELPLTEDSVPEYLDLASDLLAAVHPVNWTKQYAHAIMQDVLAFQFALQQVSEDNTNGTDDKPNDNQETDPDEGSLSIVKIQEIAPQLNYESVITQLAPQGYQLDRVGFPSEAFYKNLTKTLSETRPVVVQTFLVWKAIASLSYYVESPLTRAYNEFKLKEQGVDPGSPQPRWEKCATLLDNGVNWIVQDNTAAERIGSTGLTWILARFFADKHFTPQIRESTMSIIKYLEDAFLKRIETRNWATDKVKKAAADKLQAMTNRIGLPAHPNATKPQDIQNYYADIDITSSLVTNVLSFAKSRIAKNWAALGKPFDRSSFTSSTLVTNAFHQPQSNNMVLLAGIQQSPLYDIDYPPYMIYGGMGSIVGHEITHGFDNNGRSFDKTGKYASWFDEKSSAGFEEKSQCFIEEYSKFTVKGPDGKKVHVDGELTLGENIADAGGVLSGFSAWKQWEADQGRGQDLPGLGRFTHEQLFFLKWGQAWCQNIKPAQQVAALTDEHSPDPARILLTLKNSADFLKAFNCPQKKPACELW